MKKRANETVVVDDTRAHFYKAINCCWFYGPRLIKKLSSTNNDDMIWWWAGCGHPLIYALRSSTDCNGCLSQLKANNI